MESPAITNFDAEKEEEGLATLPYYSPDRSSSNEPGSDGSSTKASRQSLEKAESAKAEPKEIPDKTGSKLSRYLQRTSLSKLV